MRNMNEKVSYGVFIALFFSFVLSGCGGGDAASYSVAPRVIPVSTPLGLTDPPAVTVSAVSTSIAYGASTTVNWSSTKSTSCSSSGGGGSNTSGSFSTGPLSVTTTYTVTCVGAGGAASKGITISVAPSSITGFVNSAGAGNVTVTSLNSLIAGMVITISGTTSYNGTYVVVSSTSTEFVIAHNFVNAAETGVWQLGGGMISGCSTTGDTGAISLSNVPSRFTGVAPLTVFFDAVATTDSSMTSRPFHDLEYRWNFGEDPAVLATLPGGANWSTGSTKGSRNSTTGPVSAHVYEAPGVYTVALTATDGTNNVSNNCALIVVQDPNVVFANGKTVCIAATTTPVAGADGCPVGANTVMQSNFTTAISSFALTNTRVLFKKGDTFSAPTEARIAPTGPGIVGSYGTGNRPVIQSTGASNEETMGFASTSNQNWKDWRVMDLAFDGLSKTKVTGLGVTSNSGGINQLTLLRVSFSNYNNAIGFSADALNYYNMQHGTAHTLDQIAVVDCESHAGTNTSNTGYNSGSRIAFMGNSFDNGGIPNGSHVLRFTYLNKAVISNNDVMRPGFTRHTIKLHAPTWVNGQTIAEYGTALPIGSIFSSQSESSSWSNYSPSINGDGYTKYVVIADNKFTAAAEPWSISIGPQTPDYDERVQDVILERNLHVMNATSSVAQVIHASEITIRNNLYLGGGGATQTAVLIEMDGGIVNHEPPPSNVRVYNNTQYSPDAVPGNQFVMVDIEDAYASTARVSNITIKNNLAYAPNATSPLLYANPKNAANVVVSNNSSNSQIKNSSPLFTATPSATLSSWNIQTGSYAINSGLSVPVWSDVFGNVRPNGVIDIGAAEVP